MGSTISRSRIIQSESENIFRNLIPKDWIIKEQIPDYYIDFSLEIVEKGELSGNLCYVQLKGKSNLRPNHKEIQCPLSSKHLEYFLQKLKTPVFLVVVDINKKEGYWVFLQKYINDNFKKGIPNQTKSIRIPTTNILSDNISFHKAIIESQKYMTDLHSSSILSAFTRIKKQVPGLSMKLVGEGENLKLSIKGYKGPLRIKIKDEKLESYQKSIAQSHRSGELLVLKTEDTIIEGFDFINDLIKETDITEIKLDNSLNLQAAFSIFTRDHNSKVSTILNTINGKIQFGTVYGNFRGALEDSPFTLSARFKLESESKSVNVQLHLKIDYTKWNNKSILYLPYEEKLYKFFTDLKNDYEVELLLEVQGNHLFTLKNKFDNIFDLANGYITVHKFVFICKSLKYLIPFPDYNDIFKIDKDDLEIMYHLLKEGEYKFPGVNITPFVDFNSLQYDYHTNKGMIFNDNIDLFSDFELGFRDKKIVLKNVKLNLHRFEIEDIISLEKENKPITRLLLKGIKDSIVTYTYRPESSELVNLPPKPDMS